MSNDGYWQGAHLGPIVEFLEPDPQEPEKPRNRCPFVGGTRNECRGDGCALWADGQCGNKPTPGKRCPFARKTGFVCCEDCNFYDLARCGLMNGGMKNE